MSTAIKTHELSGRYQRVSALAGPNGASKATLLRMLAGLASPVGDFYERRGGSDGRCDTAGGETEGVA